VRPASPAWLLLAASLVAAPAGAATIAVGPGREIKAPSGALGRAQPGDTIAIDAGTYFDCLRVNTPRLTIEGVGGEAVLSDKTCDGKAIVVANADGLVLRNLALIRARVPDGNGAGIRAEGGSLTVEHVRFDNDEAGILAASLPRDSIVVRDSVFTGTGRCDPYSGRCANTISVGPLALLRIERTRITGTQGAHQVFSAASRIELSGVTIEDGPNGSASFQVLQEGGSLLMEDCTIEKGPRAQNMRGAVLLDGAPTGPLVLRRNRYIDHTGRNVPFVLDWSSGSPVLEGNVVPAGSAEIASSGYLAHRAVGIAREVKQDLRHLAGRAKRAVKALLGR
jgi:hypothetical protein